MSNADQVEYWNSRVGETWAQMQDRLDAAFAPVTAALIAAAAVAPGDAVLDIGCGAGDTSLAFANVVGPGGRVLGLDVSLALLARARARAAGLAQLAFRDADAATFDATSGFDIVVSRFGVMFFDDPVAAFANLRTCVERPGRLAFACWQPASENHWAMLPMQVLLQLLPPQPAADPHAPGPFAFADPARVEAILAAAGWCDVAVTGHSFDLVTGHGDTALADAVDFSMRIGPLARALAEAPDVAAAAVPRLHEALAAYAVNGRVALPAAIWLVTARA